MFKFLVFCLFYVQFLHQKVNADLVIENITEPFIHGESPLWDYENQLLYFVDTFNATVVRLNTTSGKTDLFVIANSSTIGNVVPTRSSWFKFVVGADRKLFDLSWNLAGEGSLTERASFESSKPNNEASEGKADAKGNLWFGTLSRNSDATVNNFGGSLYRVKMPEYILEQKLTNINISEGIEFSADNKHFFYTDSSNRTITKYKFDVDTGVISEPTVLFNLSTYNIQPNNSLPDGFAIDTNDNLWVAIWRAWEIVHIDGRTGELLQTIQMPVQFVTSLAFGGPDMDILYVTSSKRIVNSTELLKQPLAGSVFKITGLGVKGRPIYRIAD